MTVGSEGQVVNPGQMNLPIGAGPIVPPTQGRQGELFCAEIHGKYWAAVLNRITFNFNVTAVTIPTAANLSAVHGVYSLWNPQSSGVMMEIVDTVIGQTAATTVVDAIGWYADWGASALAGTFTTATTALSCRIGDNPTAQVVPYTNYKHNAATRVDIIGSYGAVTDVSGGIPIKNYDGRMLVPPGTVISVGATTGAETTQDISTTWIEWPFA